MEKNKLQHPLFIISVILLLCNDFYFKQAYGNVITGKLSDFAGLLAFPFFFSCLLPSWRKYIHILTAILFVWWKSSLAQPIIDVVNSVGIPVSRVVDFSDNIALISILISYLLLSKEIEFKKINTALSSVIVVVSSFSFMATSLPPRAAIQYSNVNKVYEFDLPMDNFIAKFNAMQKKEIQKQWIFGELDEGTGVFYSKNRDTISYLLDRRMHAVNDTICASYYGADFQIYEDSNKTYLRLVDVGISVKYGEAVKLDSARLQNVEKDPVFRRKYGYNRSFLDMAADTTNKDKIQKKAIKYFEKRIINKIK
ncbi:MAG: hypothetical protein LBV43_04940 [Prevotella sp.]|jgi:hypothetical protein|nr:hypothetical protein [Prevotella sp.]